MSATSAAKLSPAAKDARLVHHCAHRARTGHRAKTQNARADRAPARHPRQHCRKSSNRDSNRCRKCQMDMEWHRSRNPESHRLERPAWTPPLQDQHHAKLNPNLHCQLAGRKRGPPSPFCVESSESRPTAINAASNSVDKRAPADSITTIASSGSCFPCFSKRGTKIPMQICKIS